MLFHAHASRSSCGCGAFVYVNRVVTSPAFYTLSLPRTPHRIPPDDFTAAQGCYEGKDHEKRTVLRREFKHHEKLECKLVFKNCFYLLNTSNSE